MSEIIGVDLGTSNSAAAMLVNGSVKIIPSAEGILQHGKMFPSVITFTENGNVIVGKYAKKALHPERTVMNIKRKMGSDCKIKIADKWYIPQEISAFILKKIKKDAEVYLGKKIKKAVITCPAYFNDNQRTATRDAALLAGLDVIRIINEPTAASLAYGLDKSKRKLKIAVIDLGGGTFDVTILELADRVFRVLATAGDAQLGGLDLDSKILDYLIAKLNGKISLEDKNILQQLLVESERAKIKLSTKLSTTVNLPFGNSGITLTRAKLEELIEDVLSRMDKPLKRALADANSDPKAIDRIILVGGPTKMPCVRKKIKEFFSKAPERGIDPMHCVAIGAALQGSILSGELSEIALLDVTPLSLGIETSGAVFTKLIKRNTTIPVEERRIFTTADDFQTTVPIHVLQGERALAHDSISLGVFNLTGIKPTRRHEPLLEVVFKIDANGILHVSAEDLETCKKQAIEITSSLRLPKEEINKMIREAELFEKSDKRKEKEIRYRVRAQALIYELGQIIRKENFAQNEKINIVDLLKKLKSALRTNDIKQIKSCTEELNKVVDRITLKKIATNRANALIKSARKIIKETKLPKDEKEGLEEITVKLKEAQKRENIKELNKLLGRLSEELAIVEIDYRK